MLYRKFWMAGALLLAMAAGGEASRALAAAPEPSVFLDSGRALDRFADGEVIVLRGAADEAGLSIPLPRRVALESARLDLRYVNSSALVASRSQLVVLLNGHVVAETHLQPRQPRGELKASIPVRFFKPGFNRLSFRISQHYSAGGGCENPGSPELWTRIDASRSRLKLKFHNARIRPSLDALPALMDGRIWDRYDIQLLMPAKASPAPGLLHAGALIAQGVALQTRYLPVRVHAGRAALRPRPHEGWKHPRLGVPQRGMDAVLFGVYGALRPLLGDAWFAGLRGDTSISIERMDGDRTRFLMIVAGRDEAALSRAAHDFARLSAWREGKPEWMPDKEGVVATFARLGFATWSMRGMRGRRELRFWVSPTRLGDPERDMVLELHMSYGAGVREDSALSVFVNGRFQQAIALNHPEGQQYRHYKVRVPMSALRAGENVVTFEGMLTPLVTGQCAMIQTDQLNLTLFDDSRAYLPVSGRGLAAGPDLALLAGAGFPYAAGDEADDDAATGVLLTRRADADIGGVWTLLARIAQVGRRIVDARFVDGNAARGMKRLIVAGANRDLAGTWWRASPLGQGGAAAALLVSPGRDNVLAQSVWHGGVLTLVGAASGIGLEKAVFQLVGYDLWGQLDGNVFVWAADQARAKRLHGRALRLTPSPQAGGR